MRLQDQVQQLENELKSLTGDLPDLGVWAEFIDSHYWHKCIFPWFSKNIQDFKESAVNMDPKSFSVEQAKVKAYSDFLSYAQSQKWKWQNTVQRINSINRTLDESKEKGEIK